MRNGRILSGNQSSLTPLISFLWFFLMILGELWKPVLAQDLSLASLRTVKAATVILLGKPDEGVVRVNGRKVDGCRYISHNETTIKNLVEILKHAKIREVSHEQSFLPYIGILINLTVEDGSQVEYVFGRQYPTEEDVDGEIVTSQRTDPQALVAGRDIFRYIYQWAAKVEEVKVPDSYKSQKTEISENEQKWILDRARLLKRNGIEEIERQKRFYELSDNENLTRMLNICTSIPQKEYFRSLTSQTCEISEFYRPIPDYCEKGWKPAYHLKEFKK